MDERPLWTAVAADGSVEDVRIMDLDVPKTTWSRVHESMRVVHLRLSRQPDLQWVKFFHEERESRIGVRRRGLWIEDGYVAFDCLTNEIESHHLPDIRRSLEFANLKYREFVAARQRERSDNADAGRGELRKLEALRDRLRETFGGGKPGAAPAAAGGKSRRSVSGRGSPPAAAAQAAPETSAAPAAQPSPLAGAPLFDAEVGARHDADVAALAAAMRPPPQSAAASLDATLASYRDTLRAARRRGDDSQDQS